MLTPSELRVLDAARLVADEVTTIVRVTRPTLPNARQLREAAGSIAANIREGIGRGYAGAERNRYLRIARGSAEETDEWLRLAFVHGKIPEQIYWRLHHRLTTICRMLTALIAATTRFAPKDVPISDVPRRRERKS